ncbi:MAG: tRNA (guanosine(46)-N7)-methyltransferase TrmB [Sphaerochaetaceae bacterium]
MAGTDDVKPTLADAIEKHPQINQIEIRRADRRRGVKTFVLRGQKLGTRQIEALCNDFDKYCLTYQPEPIDFHSVFGNANPVVVEIGFGMGESTIKLAKDNPGTNFIGFEVFLFGFSKVLYKIGESGLSNLRIMRFDAIEAIAAMIPDGSVKGFHIFFPDPWQKKRHHGRRLIQKPFADLLVSKLVKGGYIYAVTDWEEYGLEMLQVLSSTAGLSNPYDGFADRIPWRPQTGFEKKGLEHNHQISEVWFERI